MTALPSPRRPGDCPAWCALDHDGAPADDDAVHVSGALMVRRTVLRLCMSGAADGEAEEPYVLLGGEEFSLHEADALIDALTELVDRGSGVSPRAGA